MTRFRCDGIFNDGFIANFQQIVKVKKIVNRSVFDEVMPKILLVRFFPDTVYIYITFFECLKLTHCVLKFFFIAVTVYSVSVLANCFYGILIWFLVSA